MLRAVWIGWMAKLTVIVLTLVNTRLLVDLVGLEGLAAYAIILSLTTWIALLNLGMPFAVQSLISKCRAEGKDYREIKATAISLVLILLVALLPLMFGIGVATKQLLLARFSFASTPAVLAACVLILLAGLTQVLSQLLFAEYQPLWPNVFPAINSLMVGAGLWLLLHMQTASFDVVLTISLLPNAVIFVMALWAAKEAPRLSLKREYIVDIFKTARGYLLFSILSAGTLAVDYLIMSRMLPAQDIATYNLLSKVFGVILSVHAVLLANAWAQMGDHLHANRYADARQRMRWLIGIGFAGGVSGGLILIFSMDWIMPLLAGDKAVAVPIGLMLGWVAYILIRIWSDSYAMGLMSFNKMSLMNAYIPFQALTNIVAQCALAYWLGLAGILLGLICSYLATAAWILPKHFYRETLPASTGG